jgi:uncharacterized membrane protein
MKRGRTYMMLFAAAILALAGAGTSAQRADSTLSGVVLAADGKPVANASVTYQSGGGVAPHAVHTDAKGRFSVSKLRADIYDVRASSQGIYSEWQKNVNVRPGQTKTLTLRLTHAKETPSASPPPS